MFVPFLIFPGISVPENASLSSILVYVGVFARVVVSRRENHHGMAN